MRVYITRGRGHVRDAKRTTCASDPKTFRLYVTSFYYFFFQRASVCTHIVYAVHASRANRNNIIITIRFHNDGIARMYGYANLFERLEDHELKIMYLCIRHGLESNVYKFLTPHYANNLFIWQNSLLYSSIRADIRNEQKKFGLITYPITFSTRLIKNADHCDILKKKLHVPRNR